MKWLFCELSFNVWDLIVPRQVGKRRGGKLTLKTGQLKNTKPSDEVS